MYASTKKVYLNRLGLHTEKDSRCCNYRSHSPEALLGITTYILPAEQIIIVTAVFITYSL